MVAQVEEIAHPGDRSLRQRGRIILVREALDGILGSEKPRQLIVIETN
jgi:hypothetical protein